MLDLPAISLTVENLACKRGERDVFAGLSFSAGSGDTVLLRGPNGAGKTSLLMCLAGYLPPASGTIGWSGVPDEMDVSELVQSIGHLPGIKSALTLSENMIFWAGLYGGDHTLIEPALDQAGLGGLGELPASVLSAGQIRRLALCRLLVAPRPVWLLDEPTSNLDVDGDVWVADLIKTHLAAGGLAIVATHRDLDLGEPVHELILEKAPA